MTQWSGRACRSGILQVMGLEGGTRVVDIRLQELTFAGRAG